MNRLLRHVLFLTTAYRRQINKGIQVVVSVIVIMKPSRKREEEPFKATRSSLSHWTICSIITAQFISVGSFALDEVESFLGNPAYLAVSDAHFAPFLEAAIEDLHLTSLVKNEKIVAIIGRRTLNFTAGTVMIPLV